MPSSGSGPARPTAAEPGPAGDRPSQSATGPAAAAAASADELAERLVAELPALVGIARSLVRDPDEAADLAQETIVAAWRRRGQLREPGALRGWLRRILLNRVVDAARARRPVLDVSAVEAEWRDERFTVDPVRVIERAELRDELTDELLDRAEDRYEQMEAAIGPENMRKVEHWLLLEAIDTHWREHLTAIEELRQSIGLQAYAQVDPLVAFKREGHDMYQQLVQNIRRQVARTIFKVRVVQQPAAQPAPAPTGDGAAASAPAQKAAPILAKASGPSPDEIRRLGAAPQGGGKGSSAAKRRKLIR